MENHRFGFRKSELTLPLNIGQAILGVQKIAWCVPSTSIQVIPMEDSPLMRYRVPKRQEEFYYIFVSCFSSEIYCDVRNCDISSMVNLPSKLPVYSYSAHIKLYFEPLISLGRCYIVTRSIDIYNIPRGGGGAYTNTHISRSCVRPL